MSLICSILLSMYLILKPYYFWSSGLPQISDVFLLLSILFFLIKIFLGGQNKISLNLVSVLRTKAVIVFYMVIVNLCWIFIENNIEPVAYIFFYVFNFFAMWVLADLLYDERKHLFIKMLINSIWISPVILFFISPIFIDFSVVRQSLTFNNPNQLGFYSLTYASILSCFSVDNKYISKIRMLISVGIAFFLALLSMSAAAILGFMILLLFFSKDVLGVKKTVTTVTIVSVTVIVFSSLFLSLYNNSFISESITARTEKKIEMSSEITIWEERGYDRIVNHPLYNVLGAGEGLRYRINSYISPLELHSMYGTIIFSYGIVGAALFLFLFLVVYKNASLFYYLIPVFLYAMTHQSLRSTTMWILVVFVIFSSEKSLLAEKTKNT